MPIAVLSDSYGRHGKNIFEDEQNTLLLDKAISSKEISPKSTNFSKNSFSFLTPAKEADMSYSSTSNRKQSRISTPPTIFYPNSHLDGSIVPPFEERKCHPAAKFDSVSAGNRTLQSETDGTADYQPSLSSFIESIKDPRLGRYLCNLPGYSKLMQGLNEKVSSDEGLLISGFDCEPSQKTSVMTTGSRETEDLQKISEIQTDAQKKTTSSICIKVDEALAAASPTSPNPYVKAGKLQKNCMITCIYICLFAISISFVD